MIDQWKTQKDRPALLQADRALAYASENNQLARADLVAQAEWALEKEEVRRRRASVTSRRSRPIRRRGMPRPDSTWSRICASGKRDARGPQEHVRIQEGRQIHAYPAGPPRPAAGGADRSPIRTRKTCRRWLRIRPIRIASTTSRPGRQSSIRSKRRSSTTPSVRPIEWCRRGPMTAHEFLKRTLDGVRTNPDITNDRRAALSDRLERADSGRRHPRRRRQARPGRSVAAAGQRQRAHDARARRCGWNRIASANGCASFTI